MTTAETNQTTPDTSAHVCPTWVGRLLASPLRRLGENPERILAPHVEPDMTVLDLGCAMGFFSLPLAKMVGPEGRVICVDLQASMLRGLEKRARRAGLSERIETRVCGARDLGLGDLAGSVDFALAYHVLHETPDQARFFGDAFAALKAGARLLVAEPRGHVKAAAFEETVAAARDAGFEVESRRKQRRGFSVVLRRAV